MLPENYIIRIWVSYFTKYLFHQVTVFFIHPVSLALMNMSVGLKPTILPLKVFHFLNILFRNSVTVVRNVILSNLD